MGNPTKEKMIRTLKKKYPGNNPTSWSRNSLKQLKEWYDECIRE